MGHAMVGDGLKHNDPEILEFRAFGVIRKRLEELLSWLSREQTQSWSKSQLAFVPWESAFAG